MSSDSVLAPAPLWEIKAAGLAAVAEAGVLALPASLVTNAGTSHAELTWVPVFAVVFVAAVVLVCQFRTAPNVNSIAAVAAVALGLAIGSGGFELRAVTVVVVLAVALRVVFLALRDWRDPIRESFVLGTLALGAEAVAASGPQPGWGSTLVVTIPLFFVASLASRATTVWTAGDATQVDQDARAEWVRRGLRGSAVVVVGMAVAAVLGLKGGVLDKLGSLLAPAGNGVVAFVVWVLAQLARPIFWLSDRLHIDAAGARRLLDRVRQRLVHNAHEAASHVGRPSLLGRLLGFLLFAAIAAGVVWLIRRSHARPKPTPADRANAPPTRGGTAEEVEPSRVAEIRWRELPRDTVRRWYAECLLALARAGHQKDPGLTPGEFRTEVGRAYPECAVAFDALTRAYEDVRYGDIALDRSSLKDLAVHHRALIHFLRRRPRQTPPQA